MMASNLSTNDIKDCLGENCSTMIYSGLYCAECQKQLQAELKEYKVRCETLSLECGLHQCSVQQIHADLKKAVDDVDDQNIKIIRLQQRITELEEIINVFKTSLEKQPDKLCKDLAKNIEGLLKGLNDVD